eukprot:TRINITY_DN4077_c0_g1_i8.p1 TRINITY_DN4077_c0_g1~~TRINITY_DN4077_c0_g1_i8.p1  ORF type:complete len:326 (-),score=40.01 TRINITY_DN4077_c0_g1_i8:159-1136(-)
MGGVDGDGRVRREMEDFNPSSDETYLIPRKKLPIGVTGAAGVCHESTLWLFGGFDGFKVSSSVQTYHPARNAWTILPHDCEMITPRSGHGVVAHFGKVYMIGGWDGLEPCLHVDQFDLRTKLWHKTGLLEHPRAHGLGVCSFGGFMWAIGGTGGNGRSTSAVERCDLESPDCRWEPRQRMQSRRSSVAVTTLYENIYAIGGYDDQNILASVERYSAADDHWVEIQGLGNGEVGAQRAWASCCTANGKIYVFGGHADPEGTDEKHMLDTIEGFDPEYNLWETCKQKLAMPRSGVATIVLNDGGLVFRTQRSNNSCLLYTSPSPRDS